MLPLYCLLSHSQVTRLQSYPYQPFRSWSTWKQPIPRMLSVQMGQASDTCSIKGIRGDLTTSLSASWSHIDQPVCDHSQPAWQLNLGPAHSQTLSFIHTSTRTPTDSHAQSDVDILWILHRCEHVYLLVSSQLKKTEQKEEGRGSGGLDRFHSLPAVKPWKQMVVFLSVS